MEVVMKRVIIIATGALLFAAFAIAQADEEPCVNQRIYGQAFQNVVAEGGLHSALSALAKGEPGQAQVSGWAVYDVSSPPVPDERCPKDFLAADITSFEWGQIYRDGSLLRGAIDPGQVFCSNGQGPWAVDITGVITGGVGRLEGLSGASWEVHAEGGNGGFTGTLRVYCD